MPMVTRSGGEVPECDQAPLTLDWGGREVVLRVNLNPCDGESLWNAPRHWLSVMRLHSGCEPWKVHAAGSFPYTHDGRGHSLEAAVADCRVRLRATLDKLSKQTRALEHMLRETPEGEG